MVTWGRATVILLIGPSATSPRSYRGSRYEPPVREVGYNPADGSRAGLAIWRRTVPGTDEGWRLFAATTVIGSLTIWATQGAISNTHVRCNGPGVPVLCWRRHEPPSDVYEVSSWEVVHRVGAGEFRRADGDLLGEPGTTLMPSFNIWKVSPASQGTLALSRLRVGHVQCWNGCDRLTRETRPPEDVPTSRSLRAIRSAFRARSPYIRNDGQIPTGTIDVQASDSTNEESTECSSPTTLLPSGPVDTGMCDWMTPDWADSPECTASPADRGLRIEQSLCLHPVFPLQRQGG